jgi:tetratricopeptide (TPR) repeat protein
MKRLLYFLLVIFAFTSCDDYVDIDPKGSAIASTIDDIDKMLKNTMAFGYGADFLGYFLDDNVKMSDEILGYAQSSQNNIYMANAYELKDHFYPYGENDRTWTSNYETVNTANYIMECLEKIPGDEKTKAVFHAEALVQKALALFSLVNVYGPHYGTPEAAQEESGVPYISVFADYNQSLKRLSVNAVYDSIVSDIKKAIPDLYEGRPAVYRTNKSSAQSVLARVYLHMGNYTEALKNAEGALSYYNELNDLNTIDTDYYPEYNINSTGLIQVRSNFNVTVYSGGKSLYALYISDELKSLYDPKDLRFSKMLGAPVAGEFAVNANDAAGWSSSVQQGTSVAEMMLIKAECLARTDKYEDAMDVITALRTKRYESDAVTNGEHVATANNKAEAIQLILDERRREFATKGMRFHTIKRVNALENANISLNRNGNTWEANSPKWALPISRKIVETSNGQIKQNER